MIIKLFTLCVFFLCTLAISAQTSYDSQKAALIIRLSDHISWPNGKIKGNFNIGIMGEDSITYKTLKDGEASLKRQNRPIKIIPIKSLSEIDNLHVLFVSKSLNHRIEKISSKIENKQILLITDHCPDPKYIMLNITYNPKLKQSAFEVNKANLMLENLSINPKLLLLGGTEVDLRDLYRTARVELEEEQQRSATQKIEIEVQEKKLVRQLFQINNLIDSTKALQESIVNKELLMLKVSNDLEQQKQEFIQHDIKYKTQQHNIYLKNREISRKIKTLDSLKLIADRNNRVIETQSAQLAINKKHIIYQKKLLTQSITIAMVFVLLGLLLLVVYIRMRLLNKRLV